MACEYVGMLNAEQIENVVTYGFEKYPYGFVVQNLPDPDYRNGPGINKSGLDMFRRSPMHFHYWRRTPKEATPAQEFGSFFHTLILEPEVVPQRYVMDGKFDRRTTAGKAAAAEFEMRSAGKVIISPADWQKAEAMRDMVMKHKIASILLDVPQADKEVSMWWQDPETGLLCKGRMDVVNMAHEALCDVKTTGDASYSGFTRSALDYFYHVQDAFYTDGARRCDLPAKRFFFICAEKDPPYAVAVYRLDVNEFQRVGREIYRRDLIKYRQCLETDTWPGYAEEVRDLQLPAYGRFQKIS